MFTDRILFWGATLAFAIASPWIVRTYANYVEHRARERTRALFTQRPKG